MFLKEFEDSLSEYLGVKTELSIEGINISDNEEMILSTKLKSNNRFLRENLSEKINFLISRNKGLDIISYGTLSEFPRCCGKAIFSGIKISEHYYERCDENGANKYVRYSDDQVKYILNSTLKLVYDICKNAKYSSVDFIVSEKEQPLLYKSLSEINCTPILSFKNYRMNNKNICHNYSMEIKYD